MPHSGRKGNAPIYNVIGHALILICAATCCMVFAPPALGPWIGLAIGAAYFVACWFVGGLYQSCVIHLGITHRSLDYKEWFVRRSRSSTTPSASTSIRSPG
jgi:hypothetical protein